MQTENKPKKKRKSFLQKNWHYLLVSFICSIYLLWAIPHWVFKPDEAGQFGDLFGAITALIGTFSVLLLIQSLRLQQRELHLARREYKLGLAEMKEQTLINSQQLLTNKLQRFENTFYNSLNIFLKVRESLKSVVNDRVWSIEDNIHNHVSHWREVFKNDHNDYQQTFHKSSRELTIMEMIRKESYYTTSGQFNRSLEFLLMPILSQYKTKCILTY